MGRIADPREARLFARMEERSGIDRRHTVLSQTDATMQAGSFYARPEPPTTADRMRIYAGEAPELALRAVRGVAGAEHATHLVLASCTGFIAPGIDQLIARELRLRADIERVCIGFMGCYAGVTALRTAAHIVRSDPAARVLVISVELCSLHLQPTRRLEPLLAMAQFADGAAAAMVTGDGPGLALGRGLSLALDNSEGLIAWTIGDTGFAMELSGEVPGRFADTLARPEIAASITGGRAVETFDGWAVHPGGRSVLDAVERGLGLRADALDASRHVLRECGNMSSATVLFVLARMMESRPARGLALAFGPGLAVEGLHFNWTQGDAG